MLALTLLVGSIAIADSVNPSTVVPALYLAGRPRAHGLASFTLGVFAVYLAGGVVLVLGPGPAVIGALRHVGPQLEHMTEAAAGAALIMVALLLWRRRGRRAQVRPTTPACRSRGSSFALGAAISAVELPTAFMYFGAVTAILGSRSGAPTRVSLVFAYNALFVLPLVAILALRVLTGERSDLRLHAAGAWLRRAAPLALTAVAAAAGSTLVSLGTAGMLSA